MGASAGGLEAFTTFFQACPSDMRVAFILVSHLAPDHVSMLTEILQRHTSMPVHEAVDQLRVSANNVYVIPPDREMEILNGVLQLCIPNQARGHRMLIDTFLRSLADDQQENAIGIIFSGTGSDGVLGLRAIHSMGGLTLVQEPESAKYTGMPVSAIKSGYVSQVLVPEKMPAALLSCKYKKPSGLAKNQSKQGESGYNHIILQLRKTTGHDFSLYKKSTIGRRIERRMLQHEIADADIYAQFLKKNPDEIDVLFKELLINVTSFFRDNQAFDVLQKEILPPMLKAKSNDDVFRIWVAGCSTGEEAYSIAIVLFELLESSGQDIGVKIFATDLDPDAITIARAGIYSKNIIKNITNERLLRFFTKVEEGYKVNKVIREMVMFAVQSVIKDPPFTKLDLLACRNLMIYLEPDLQSRLMSTFHYALKSSGVLFLSPSESIGNHSNLFKSIDRKWKFYAAKHSAKFPDQFTMSNVINVSPKGLHKSLPPSGEIMKQPSQLDLTELSQNVLVRFFAPASVIVDSLGNILYVHGETGKYLRPAPGKASLNVIEMAREGLEVELRAAIYGVVKEAKKIHKRKKVQFKNNNEINTVQLSVHPINGEHEDTKELLLVSFLDVPNEEVKPKRKASTKSLEAGIITGLEQDLLDLKDSHRIIAEEQQASGEELKSTNEELQSTNEEMQSTNEELETSKEELQSVNEELITVNAELQSKVGFLDDIKNDLKNLLDSINVGIIYLDKHLNIRSFTQDACQIYRLNTNDVGRPLSDIKCADDVVCDDIGDIVDKVLASLIPHEMEIQIGSKSWFMARIQPYRTLDDFIDGVILTFTDITLRIQSAKAALNFARCMVNTVREPLIVLDASLDVVAVSKSFYQQFEVTQDDTVGHNLFDLGNKQWDIPLLRQMLNEVLLDKTEFEDYTVRHNFPNIGVREMKLNARRIDNEVSEPSLILLAIDVNNEH